MKGGRVLLALMLIAGLVGWLVNGAAVYVRMLYLGVLLLVISWIWARLSLRGMKISRQARSLRGSVGDIFEEHFEITNGGQFSCLWLEVMNSSTMPGVAGSRLLTGIGRRQRRSYNARTWLVRRGSFPLGPTVLTAGDPFGLFRSQKQFPAQDSLIVLPMIVGITEFPTPPGLLPGGKPVSRKAIDITPHASGVREYVPGDPMKRIHWPTTVRCGKLMVKEFDQDPQAEVWLFLDAQASVHYEQKYDLPVEPLGGWLFSQKPMSVLPPSTLEYAITVAASLAHYFIQKRWAVGFAASGQIQTVIPAERSFRQEHKILEMMAFLDAKGRIPLNSLVTAQARQLPRGSTVILITPSVKPELVLAVDDLQRRNLRPMVILLMADSFGGPKGGALLAKTLVERNIPVCRVLKGSDLAQTLTYFASNTLTHTQEYRWYQPQYTS
jgi:uncharacterized protein (DUF58 family)